MLCFELLIVVVKSWRTGRGDDQVDQHPAVQERDVQHPLVHQEPAQVFAGICHGRAVRRALLDDQDPGLALMMHG